MFKDFLSCVELTNFTFIYRNKSQQFLTIVTGDCFYALLFFLRNLIAL